MRTSSSARNIQRYFINRHITPNRLAQISAAQHHKVQSVISHPKLKQIYKEKSRKCKRLTPSDESSQQIEAKSSRTCGSPEQDEEVFQYLSFWEQEVVLPNRSL